MNKTVDSSSFEGKTLFLTTPCYGAKVNSDFAMAISALRCKLEAFNIKYSIYFLNNDSLISRARSKCATKFLSDTYWEGPKGSLFTHMMFIDADTGFDPNDVLKFLYSDEDILVGAVPKKKLPIEYNTVAVLNDDGEYITHKERFLEVEYGGTAFMMIKREVFEKMQESYPELKHEPFDNELCPSTAESSRQFYIKNSYAYFDTQILPRAKKSQCTDNKTLRYFAEDYMFCRRWTDMGGKILLDPSVKLNHYGDYLFEGDLTGNKEYASLSTAKDI